MASSLDGNPKRNRPGSGGPRETGEEEAQAIFGEARVEWVAGAAGSPLDGSPKGPKARKPWQEPPVFGILAP